MHTIQTIGLWGVVYNSSCQEKSNFCIDDPLCGKSILLVAFMMMSWHGNIFCITGSLWENPLTKGQWWGALMFSLLSEYAVEHTVQLQLIWDIVILMWCPCYGCIKDPWSTCKDSVIKWNFNDVPMFYDLSLVIKCSSFRASCASV